MTTIDPSQTDESGALSAVSPVDDLQSIAPLILDLERRDAVLAGLDGPTRLRAEDVLQSAAQLTSMTEWSGERLLQALGCRFKADDEPDARYERLGRCQQFLHLVARMTGLVDTTADRRAVVEACADLLVATGQDSERLEDLLRAPGAVTGIDYLRLGEISAAVEHVLALAAPASVTRAAADADDFYAIAPTVHLSTTRIDMYLAGDVDGLGAEVASHIELHVAGCDPCRDAVDARRAIAESSPAAR
jgi:hypothetical protein